MNLSTSTFGTPTNLPISKLARRTYFQGAAWARDPNNGEEWFFQLQARPTGPGDVEDMYVHRYRLNGYKFTYVDTMHIVGSGHCQTLKVRISAMSRPWVWLGFETYDAKGSTTGQQVYKVRFRTGTVTRTSLDVQRIWLKSGHVTPLDAPDWTVGIRRPSGDTEVYEWYDEKVLLDATEDDPARPTYSLRVPKAAHFHCAALTGDFNNPEAVYRVNGLTNGPDHQDHTLYRFPAASGQPSEEKSIDDLVPESGYEEPEGVLTVRGELWIGKQTHPSSSRVLSYTPLVEGPLAA